MSTLLSSSQASKGIGGIGWQRDDNEGKMGRHIFVFVINVDVNINTINSDPLSSILPYPADKAYDFSFVISPGCAYWLSDIWSTWHAAGLAPPHQHTPLARCPTPPHHTCHAAIHGSKLYAQHMSCRKKRNGAERAVATTTTCLWGLSNWHVTCDM